MNVSIFGLGYVGSVTAGCLASLGHHVIGVDVNPEKVSAVNKMHSPVIEQGLEEMIGAAVRDENLVATCDVAEAIAATDLALICVGTPSDPNGNLDFDNIDHVVAQIGAALRENHPVYKVVAVRSTLLPGVLKTRLLPVLEKESGLEAGSDFGMAINPEFLREGSAVNDFMNPAFTLIGELDERSGNMLVELYTGIPAPVLRAGPDEASMVKYASNAFHALKVTFANEIGQLCKKTGVDSNQVMEIFCQDTRLNISARYLRPGFAFGGSCLPKDLRAMTYLARHNDLELPVLESILPSNRLQIQRAVDLILRDQRKTVGIIGLSFKPNTDDLRESPIVELVEILTGKGLQVKIFDDNILLSRLIGGNKAYIERVIPHISGLMQPSMDEAVNGAGIIVVSHGLRDGLKQLASMLKPDQLVIDLTRIPVDDRSPIPAYEGISW